VPKTSAANTGTPKYIASRNVRGIDSTSETRAKMSLQAYQS